MLFSYPLKFLEIDHYFQLFFIEKGLMKTMHPLIQEFQVRQDNTWARRYESTEKAEFLESSGANRGDAAAISWRYEDMEGREDVEDQRETAHGQCRSISFDVGRCCIDCCEDSRQMDLRHLQSLSTLSSRSSHEARECAMPWIEPVGSFRSMAEPAERDIPPRGRPHLSYVPRNQYDLQIQTVPSFVSYPTDPLPMNTFFRPIPERSSAKASMKRKADDAFDSCEHEATRASTRTRPESFS